MGDLQGKSKTGQREKMERQVPKMVCEIEFCQKVSLRKAHVVSRKTSFALLHPHHSHKGAEHSCFHSYEPLGFQ